MPGSLEGRRGGLWSVDPDAEHEADEGQRNVEAEENGDPYEGIPEIGALEVDRAGGHGARDSTTSAMTRE